MIKIVPVTLFGNKQATEVGFGIVNVILGQYAAAQYYFLDADGVEIYRDNIQMTPEQYAQWGTDDTYPITCFLTNLGLTKI